MAQKLSKTTTDHETIRRWVEERGGTPAEVASTARGDDVGIIRIDFPGYGGEGRLREISWDEWFGKFEDGNLAFVYQEETSGGQRSNFNKLVGRETARARAAGRRTLRRGSRRGTSARGKGRTSSARTRSAGGRSTRKAAGTRRTGRAAPARRGAQGRRSASRSEAARTTARRAGSRSRSGSKSRTTTRSGSRSGSRSGRRSR